MVILFFFFLFCIIVSPSKRNNDNVLTFRKSWNFQVVALKLVWQSDIRTLKMLPNNQSSIHSAVLNLQDIVTFLLHLAKERLEARFFFFFICLTQFLCLCLSSDCFIMVRFYSRHAADLLILVRVHQPINRCGQISSGQFAALCYEFQFVLHMFSVHLSHWDLPTFPLGWW